MRDLQIDSSDLIIRIINEDDFKVLGKICLTKGTLVFPICAFGLYKNGDLKLQEVKHRGEVAKLSENGKFGFRGVDDTGRLINAFLNLYKNTFVN